jgi:hypothetical protein
MGDLIKFPTFTYSQEPSATFPAHTCVKLIRIRRSIVVEGKWELFTIHDNNSVAPMALGEFEKSTAEELARKIQGYVDNVSELVGDVVSFAAQEVAKVMLRVQKILIDERPNNNGRYELFTLDEHNAIAPMGLGEFTKPLALELVQAIEEFIKNKTDLMSVVKLFAIEEVSRREEDWEAEELNQLNPF